MGSSMTYDHTATDELFEVVINAELQYSIWQVGKAIPDGWSAVGMQGAKQACLEYIDAHWTDMRPRSLREQMSDLIGHRSIRD
nr:MbtH family NRPS accessory protein [Chitinimonas sp.]